MGNGSISLLIDSPLKDFVIALRGLGPEMRKQIATHTKAAANPIWFEETRGRAETRLQQRELVNTARVGVTSRNVLLRAGGGRLDDAAEFGANPNRIIKQRSRKGNTYSRRLGNAFGPPRRGGYVVYPAAKDSIPRFASLWVQTARRTLHDLIEKVT